MKKPPDRRIVPLDSKFSLSENIFPNIELAEGDILLFDKDQRKKINELIIKMIPEVAKYINPSSGTMNFALMFIPDSVYLALRDETLKKLQSSRIIPVNTSGLLSTLFLIERQYTSIKISKVVDQLEDIKSTVETNFSSIKKKIGNSGKTQSQFEQKYQRSNKFHRKGRKRNSSSFRTSRRLVIKILILNKKIACIKILFFPIKSTYFLTLNLLSQTRFGNAFKTVLDKKKKRIF
ncbi:MAG: DNA recombination protein RmuC [Candidatus Helarchaeota archaeon]